LEKSLKNIDSYNLKNLILNTIELYNKNKILKSISKLVIIENCDFIIEFDNSSSSKFKNIDFYEDFIIEFEEISKFDKLEFIEIKSLNEKKFLIRFQLCNHIDKLENHTLFQKFLKSRNLSFKQYLALNSCSKDVIRFHFRTWLFEQNE
jgi:hypothetical protein